MIKVDYIMIVKGYILFLADALSTKPVFFFSTISEGPLISHVELLIMQVGLGHCGRPAKALRWTGHNHPPADNYDGSSEAVCVIIISVNCRCVAELHLNEFRESPHTETQPGNKNK